MGSVQSAVPYEAQLNKISVPLACTSSGGADLAGIANLTLSATAPLYGGAGQQIYFSDLAGSFNIPPVPEDGQGTFPRWSLTLFVNTSISNASPSEGVPILQSVSQNSTDGNFVFPGPYANGPLPPLGPFTLGDAGQISELALGSVSGRLDFITRANSVRVSSFWQCGPANPPYVISSVPITNDPGPASAPSNGDAGGLPDIAVGEKYTLASVGLDCSGLQGIGTTFSTNFTIAGVSPASVQNGSLFEIHDVATFLTIPGSIARVLDNFYGSNPPYGPTYGLGLVLGKSFRGEDLGEALNVTTTNGEPQALDIGRYFDTSYANVQHPLNSVRYVPAGDPNDQPFPLPQVGSITIGNFTAGNASTTFSITNVSTTFTFLVVANNGLLCGYEAFACKVRSSLNLFSLPIN